MTNPLETIRRELADGVREIAISKGVYRVSPPEGSGTYLALRGLRDATLDFGGAELRGLANTRFLLLEDCENVVVRNLALDYETPPYTQAEIVAVDSDGAWTLRTLDGYPAPPPALLREIWPFQVYGRETLELVNPMRMGDGFKVIRTGPREYRASGGVNRAGGVGDIAVWNVFTAGGKADLGGGAERNAVHCLRCRRCVFKDVAVYATPGGRAFEEHSCEANEYRRCRIVRRAPEDDFAAREVPRLRSGGHDAFMSRRAVVGPKILDCVAQYHCDDAVNVSGVFAVVSAVEGRRVRLVSISESPFAAGDTAQVMGMDGTVKPELAVTAVEPQPAAATESERAFLRSIGLWPGLAEQSPAIASEIEVADVAGLARGDAVISNRAQGSGFEIRGCVFGHNRAFGMRIRASNGVIADNTVEATEGWGLFIGPEYEWLEGGISHDIAITGNDFRGCGVAVGGTAAFRHPLPPGSLRNVAPLDQRLP